MGEHHDDTSRWRAGWVQPTWFRDAHVATCRDEALLAHRDFLDLVPSGQLSRHPTEDQLMARYLVIDADAAYEAAKAEALRASEV